MARIGEGDPRWIVQNRPDGTNVNQWHWEERDMTKAVHDALKDMWRKYSLLETTPLKMVVLEATDIDGDVTIAKRKGKIMCYFSLKISLKLRGTSSSSGSTGTEIKVTFPEIDHDNLRDDFEIRIEGAEGEALEWTRKEGRKHLRQQIVQFFEELFAVNGVGKAASKSSPPPTTTSQPPRKDEKPQPESSASAASADARTSLSFTMKWNAPVSAMWMALTDPQRVSVYTRAPAKIDPRPTGSFELLNGAISGYYVDVVPQEKIVMQWRLSHWKAGTHSSVIISMRDGESGVSMLEFGQAGIPPSEAERVEEGWKVNFWEPIKLMFGYGMDFV